jgi:hypothetical protein
LRFIRPALILLAGVQLASASPLSAQVDTIPDRCARHINNVPLYQSCAERNRGLDSLYHQQIVKRIEAQGAKELRLSAWSVVVMGLLFLACIVRIDTIPEEARAPLLVAVAGISAASILGIFNSVLLGAAVAALSAIGALASRFIQRNPPPPVA